MTSASAVEAVFFGALGKPDAAERTAYLDAACAEDAELRRQVEKLLKAHPEVGEFLQRPVLEQLTAETEPFGASDTATDGGAGDDAEETLDFLQSSTRPDALGRLGHYEILEVLGRGGFGIVFRAFDESLHRIVAVKVLAPMLAAMPPQRRRFLREARSSARIRHENVVRVYAVEEHPLPYLVMEYIPGETLQQRLDRSGPLPTQEVLQFGRQLAEALAAAHAMALVHRDIKPANVLLEAGPRLNVKLTDFGLALTADDATVTPVGLVAGTPMFMAPEQAHGDTVDARADLFSLGSVLYTMCSGRPPFRASSPLGVLKRVAEDTPRPIHETAPDVPSWLVTLIERLHAKKPEERFASAQAVAELLASHLVPSHDSGHAVVHTVAASTTIAPRRRRPATWPRSRMVRGSLAAILLMLLGGVGWTEATGVTDLHATVIRFFSPDGTLVVEVDDPDIRVKIDGSEMVITGAGPQEIRLRPGTYNFEASKDGKLVRHELITVTKNGREVVRVIHEPAPPVAAVNPIVTPMTDVDRQAAQYVLSGGGTVWVNGEEQKILAGENLPRDPFRLTSIGLQGKKFTDDGMTAFKDCKHLTRLMLYNNLQLTDAGLANFKDCKKLTQLHLQGTKVTDASLKHFQGTRIITDLYLSGPTITDVGLACFKDCREMVHLSLERTRVTDAGLAQFNQYPNLLFTSLNGTKVSDQGLAHLTECKNLGFLHLKETQVTDAGLPHLAKLKKLTWLSLDQLNLSAKGVEALAAALPRCKITWNGGEIRKTQRDRDDLPASESAVVSRPATERVSAIAARNQDRNPGSDGKVSQQDQR